MTKKQLKFWVEWYISAVSELKADDREKPTRIPEKPGAPVENTIIISM